MGIKDEGLCEPFEPFEGSLIWDVMLNRKKILVRATF